MSSARITHAVSIWTDTTLCGYAIVGRELDNDAPTCRPCARMSASAREAARVELGKLREQRTNGHPTPYAESRIRTLAARLGERSGL